MTTKSEDHTTFFTPENPGRGMTDAERESVKRILDQHKAELLALGDE
jgi:hypothetical protein